MADFDNPGRRFTEDEISLLMAFADQAALALEKARLLNEAETERERADSLYRISNLLAGAHDTVEVLNLIVNEAARLVATPAAVIRILEGDVLVLGAATKAAAAFAAENSRLRPALPAGEGSVLGELLDGKKPTIYPDAAQLEGLFPSTRALLQKYGFHGSVGIPLVANDRSIGTLVLFDQQIRQFTEDEVSLLSAFADQAALALEKARLLNEAETERERSDALYRVSNLLAGAHDTDEVLDLIVNEAARLVGAPAAYIRLLEGGFLVTRAATESLGELGSTTLAVGEGFMGHVMATKKPRVAENMEEEELLTPESRKLVQATGFVSAAAVPLLANGGQNSLRLLAAPNDTTPSQSTSNWQFVILTRVLPALT